MTTLNENTKMLDPYVAHLKPMWCCESATLQLMNYVKQSFKTPLEGEAKSALTSRQDCSNFCSFFPQEVTVTSVPEKSLNLLRKRHGPFLLIRLPFWLYLHQGVEQLTSTARRDAHRVTVERK